MQKREIVKTIVSQTTSFGAGYIVGQAITTLTPAPVGLPAKIVIGVGRFGIGAAVGAAAGMAMGDMIDDICVAFDDLVYK